MKKLFIACALVMYPVVKTSACSMPLPAIGQKLQMDRALESKALSNALNKEISRDPYVSIEKVEFKKGVDVVLSNGCTITVNLKYGAPRHPGLCPEYKGAVARTTCL